MSHILKTKFISSIEEIPKDIWAGLINTSVPFVQYEFLLSLEQSQVVGGSSGWMPYHLICERVDIKPGQEHEQKTEIVAVAPGYLKTHSYGEYVFDFEWAAAYQRYQLNYYPKYVTAVPFTPATGERFFVLDTANKPEVITHICAAVREMAAEQGVSSWHTLFPNALQSNQLGEEGIFQRVGAQYHWLNNDYSSFDDFLSRMNKKHRKNIKRERNSISSSDVVIKRCEGADITQEQIEQFYQFYCMTYAKRSGHFGYLNQACFTKWVKSIPQHLMFAFAEKDETVIAGAMFFKDKENLYGRYWGCIVETEFLHFELCYYQGIEYAIENNLKKFDAGAQGEHKISRGFEPCRTYSNHYIADEQLRGAIKHFVEEEKPMVESRIKLLAEKLPFKRS